MATLSRHKMNYLELRSVEKKYISKDIQNIGDDESFLLIGFGITNPLSIEKMSDDWEKSDSKTKALGRTESASKKIRPLDFGGSISLLRISNKKPELLVDWDVLTPMGLCVNKDGNKLLVGSSFGIFEIYNGEIKRNLEHNLFSQVHGISKSTNGYIAACTNTDSIVEFSINDDSNKVTELWNWIASEKGFNKDTKGNDRTIDHSKNYQFLDEGGTRSHSTHLNSAIEYNDNHILTTLFHQDQLIKIDKKDGSYEVILDNITNPHHIKKDSTGGYLVSATRDNGIYTLDDNLKVKQYFSDDYNWVQDSEVFDQYYVISDNNNSRLVFTREGKKEFEINWDNNARKVSNMISIKGSEVKKIFLNNT